MQYTTKAGDRLDIIYARHYGTVNGTVEAVLYAPENDDLVTYDVFPAGVTITLPVVKPQAKKTEYSIWD